MAVFRAILNKSGNLEFDAILPIIIVPGMLLQSTSSFWWTVFTFTSVLVALICLRAFLLNLLPRTRFFTIWNFMSVLVLYIIFEVITISMLKILWEENVAVSAFFASAIICAYHLKQRTSPGKLPVHIFDGTSTTAIECGTIKEWNCHICGIIAPARDHHNIWLNCCIGPHNQCLFIGLLIFSIITLIYSANLTLTSVCHPIFFSWTTILLPDDCSNVYMQFETSICFVAALYSLIIAAILMIVLIQQIIIVCVGISTIEWVQLPFSSKIMFGLTTYRSRNLGIIRNWSRIIFWRGRL